MTAYIIRRLVWLPILLILVSVVTFALGVYGPGNPVQVMLGLHTNPVIIQQVRAELGLDEPFYVQYWNYISNVLHFNLGYSIVKYQGQSITDLLQRRLPVTLQLNLISILWSVPAGIGLGIYAGVRRNSFADLFSRSLVILGISLPVILLLPLLTFLLSRRHDLTLGAIGVPLGPFLPVSGWNGILAPNIVLPALIEGLGPLAVFTRQTRAGIIEAMEQDYIRTARAKGLREQMVVVRHALRNALLPLVTITGFMLGGLLEGSFLVEPWFGIPGVGALAYESLFSRDYYIILAFTLLAAVGYTLANLFIDIGYALVDPRIRHSAS